MQVNLSSNQDMTVQLKYLGNYPASLDKYYTPVHGPLNMKVQVYPQGVADLNFGDNTVYEPICGYKGADIVTRNYVSLNLNGAKNWKAFSKWTTQNLSDAGLNWVKGGFKARIYLPVYNYGCAWRTFDAYLYIDKQKGQFLGKYTLGPGQWTAIDKVVTIAASVRAKPYQMVIIADQAENTDQPYPNSYMNNFVNTSFILVHDYLIGGG